MLTLLRKIRRSLIESGSARTYTLYAIGEIALVVIGILFAIQINSWNEARKEQRAIHEYLVQLQHEFQGLLSKETNELERSDRIIEQIKKCQFIINDQEIKDLDIFKTCLSYLGTASADRPIHPIFSEFMREGWMSKIKDDQLSTNLTRLNEAILLVAEFDEHIIQQYTQQIFPFFKSQLNTSDLPMLEDVRYIDLVSGGPNVDYQTLLRSHDLWNLCNEKISITAFKQKAQSDLIGELKATLKLFDQFISD